MPWQYDAWGEEVWVDIPDEEDDDEEAKAEAAAKAEADAKEAAAKAKADAIAAAANDPATKLPAFSVNATSGENPGIFSGGTGSGSILTSGLNSSLTSNSGSNIFADPTTIAASPVYTNRSYGAGNEAMDKIANEALDRINKARVAAGYPPHTVQSASNAGIETQINNEVKQQLDAIAAQEDAAARLAARNNPTVNPLAAAANAALGVGTSIFNGAATLVTDPLTGVTNIANNVGSAISGGGQSGTILPIPGIGGAAAAIATGAILANPQSGATAAASGAGAGAGAAGSGTTPGQTTPTNPVVIGSGALGGATGSGEAKTDTTAVTTGSLGGAVTTPPVTTTTTTNTGSGETVEQQNARITGIVQAGVNQQAGTTGSGDSTTSTATKTTIFTGVPQQVDTNPLNQSCGIGFHRDTPTGPCVPDAIVPPPVTPPVTTSTTTTEACQTGFHRDTPNGPCVPDVKVVAPTPTSTSTATATSTFTHLPWIVPTLTNTPVAYEPNTIQPVARNVGTEGGQTSSALAALRNQLVSLYGSAASGYSDADLTNYLNMQQGLSGANAENTRQAAQQTRDANRLLRENNLQDVENNYQKALGLRRDANQGLYSSLDQYTQQAQAQSAADQARIAQAGILSREDTRDAQQAAREAWAARGMVNSEGAVGSEILNRDALVRQRENEARAYGQQSSGNLYNAVGANTANVFDPMNAILGQQYGMQTNNMGSNAQLFNQGAALSSGGLGNQYAQNVFNPFSTYSNDVYGTNINAYYADQIAKRNNAAAIEGARLSGNYNLAGTALGNLGGIAGFLGKGYDFLFPK
jgi:hypothetical protein